MNTNVAQLLLILAGGIGDAAVLQAALRRRGPSRRSFALGAHIMHG
jgi:NAD(P)H-dependent flavin oxidoreductase YrpB (nitropropane dioxygenase family)